MIKRFLIFCVVLLLSCPVWAQDDCIVVKKAGGGCDPGTNEVGDRSTYTTGYTSAADRMVCMLYTADCGPGTLGNAWLLHNSTGGDYAKVCVYLDDGDSVPDSGDTIVGSCSNALTSNTDGEWVESSGDLGGTIANGSPYWVCFVTDASAWQARMDNVTGTRDLRNNNTSSYSSPPSNLDGTWGTTGSRELSMYVEIQ